jgi:hypothetical protein
MHAQRHSDHLVQMELIGPGAPLKAAGGNSHFLRSTAQVPHLRRMNRTAALPGYLVPSHPPGEAERAVGTIE